MDAGCGSGGQSAGGRNGDGRGKVCSLRAVDFDIQRGYAWGGKPHTVRFSSPNPTFSACCQWVWTFVPFGLRGRDSPMAWLRQYQYNLHSPLQPGVVKALLLVLRSSAALALAAVAQRCFAQFIRMRTARSPRRGSQPVCKSTACRLHTSPVRIHSKRLQTANRSCDEAELRSEGVPGETSPGCGNRGAIPVPLSP